MNKPTVEQYEEYVQLLRSHDWHYDYSDDHSVWVRGREQANKIAATALKHVAYDQTYQMWVNTVVNRERYQDVQAHRTAFVDAVKRELSLTTVATEA